MELFLFDDVSIIVTRQITSRRSVGFSKSLLCFTCTHTLQLLFAMSLDSWHDTSILSVLNTLKSSIRVVSSAYVGVVRTGYQTPFLAVLFLLSDVT